MEQTNTVILDLEEYKRLYEISKVFENNNVIKSYHNGCKYMYIYMSKDEAINDLIKENEELQKIINEYRLRKEEISSSNEVIENQKKEIERLTIENKIYFKSIYDKKLKKRWSFFND